MRSGTSEGQSIILPFGIPFQGRDEFRAVPAGTEVSLQLSWHMPWGTVGRLVARAALPLLRRQLRGNAARAAALCGRIGVNEVQSRLIKNGVILVLLGSLSGLAPMVVTNARMGLAAHVGGVMTGLLLLGLGAVWSSVRLGPGQERLAVGLLLWATYGNWAITLVASVTGAKEFAPLAGAGYGASAIVETGTLVFITTAAIAILAGLGLVLLGLAKHRA